MSESLPSVEKDAGRIDALRIESSEGVLTFATRHDGQIEAASDGPVTLDSEAASRLLAWLRAHYSTGAIVPERQRCICRDICVDHCRACNHSGRDLEETCISDPDWEPDDEYLAIREARVLPPGM